MSDKKQDYDDIVQVWEDEIEYSNLTDLEDLKLSRMSAYLSDVRLNLAETSAENQLQADLLTQEALNVEFMLKEILTIRRSKILNAALESKNLDGAMTLSEEELYNRLVRGVDSHSKFVDAILAGTSTAEVKKPKKKKSKDSEPVKEEAPEDIEHVTVRFLTPVDAFMGL
ncbi:MAG: hypothetical protein ACTSU3_01230, partial [Candidatus Thorarchaeota archaeon]